MPKRNPTWSRDELILALDLYVRFQGNPPGKASEEVVLLSERLNKLSSNEIGRNADFRNPNGVYMKVMNFRRFDPAYTAQGKVGLSRGGKGDGEVWENFASRPERLSQAAVAIQGLIDDNVLPREEAYDEDVAEAEEGRMLTRLHRQRERNRSIVDRKKSDTLQRSGKLICEACGFNFEASYGARGRGYIEAHHTKPVHTLRPSSRTKLTDLALVCSNCHRMIHTKRPWLTVEELQLLMRKA